jgi:hypothetical protein
MNKKLGNLELKKVENEYRIKELTKAANDQVRRKKELLISRNRFIDDYEQ